MCGLRTILRPNSNTNPIQKLSISGYGMERARNIFGVEKGVEIRSLLINETRPFQPFKERVGDIIAEANQKNLLKTGSNQIETMMNGQPATIRAFFSPDGQLMRANLFPGITNRKLGNLIQ